MLTLQLTLAARYLWGRKLRSFLTTLAIIPARQAAQLEIIRALRYE